MVSISKPVDNFISFILLSVLGWTVFDVNDMLSLGFQGDMSAVS